MNDVTRILNNIQQGDLNASEDLLPLIYDELRQLASARLKNENACHSLGATELVHEAYLRLVGTDEPINWDSKGHFFAAAAAAIRRILVERARKRKSEKHGGRHTRKHLGDMEIPCRFDAEELLELDDTLKEFAKYEAEAINLVQLCVFADFSVEEAGKLLGMSRATAYRNWNYARAWLKQQLAGKGI